MVLSPRQRNPRASRTVYSVLVWLSASLLLPSCVTSPTPASMRPEVVRSHVYALPITEVLTGATAVLVEKGWRVQRAGNVLFTNWRGESTQSPQQFQAEQSLDSSGRTLVGYRVVGEPIDAGYCTIRIERLTATPSTLSFGERQGGHPVDLTTSATGRGATPIHNENREVFSELLPEFQEDAANESAATGVPTGMIVSQHQRDLKLEMELQEQIDPAAAAPARASDAVVSAVPAENGPDAGAVGPEGVNLAHHHPGEESDSSRASPSAERRSTALGGIWNGTFTFRGYVTGSFSGEVTVAVDGDSVEVDDFCPENGGTVIAHGSRHSAAWQGELACPSIRLRGCPAATFTYNFVNATLDDATLTVFAAGRVDTDVRCTAAGGALSVAFVAHKADYVHIAVTKVKKATACNWPSDWEDFTSAGSMPMPELSSGDTAYLGIIRARGSRLAEIQRLLRHCRQLVLLHGQVVLMRLAATRPQLHGIQ
jgi:hypothetical protein